jgi:hypothetical protein
MNTVTETNILTLQGYFDRVCELRRIMTLKAAYDVVEGELADRFGVFRYSSFESFEVGLYRFHHFQFKQI